MSKNLEDCSSYQSTSSIADETEFSREELAYIDKKRSKSWNKKKRRAAYRQNKPEGWYMEYFEVDGVVTPRFNHPQVEHY